jgi:hypothetical protein
LLTFRSALGTSGKHEKPVFGWRRGLRRGTFPLAG